MKASRRITNSLRPLRMSAATEDERGVVALLDLLPDDPPDRAFIERAWQGLGGRHPRASQSWRWAFASALALAVAATVALGLGRSSAAQLLLVEGSVSTGRAGTSWVPARPGESLKSGARLESDASGSSVLRLPGVAAILAESRTELVLEYLGEETRLRLVEGAVTLRVTKRPTEHPFVIRVGDYTVTVVGTLFGVAQQPDGRMDVGVAEGAVRVSKAGAQWRVAAGEHWSSDAPDSRTVETQVSRSGSLLAAAMGASPDGRLSELFHALVQERMRDPQPKPTSTPLAHLAEPVPLPTLPPPEAPHRTNFRRPTKIAVAESASASAASPTTPPPPPPASPQPDPYAEALALERKGEHRLAAAKLEGALASNLGPRDLELYHLALLRERHLNDPKGALDALLSYRAGFPAGGLRQEVDLSVIETRLALGQTDATLAESATFLARYPQSERADEMRFMRGDLLRRRGDCAAALAEYRAVSRGPVLDDALYYSAYCLRELGQPDAATRDLGQYLQRFPNGKHVRAAHEALGQ